MPECKCPQCVELCKFNPGWMTPAEANVLMDAGYAPRLMLDWWEPSKKLGNEERIFIIAPASLGYEGKMAPEMFSEEQKGRIENVLSLDQDAEAPETYLDDVLSILQDLHDVEDWNKGRCNFLTDDSLCAIHSMKPLQCRMAMGCEDQMSDKEVLTDNMFVAALWQGADGLAAVKRWRALVGMEA